MRQINISHITKHKGVIHEVSSNLDNDHSIQNILTEEGHWCTAKSDSFIFEYFVIDYNESVPINYFEISASENGKTAFPIDFRIEASNDSKHWKIIHTEKKLNLEDSTVYTLNIPIILERYIKVLITKSRRIGTKYLSEVGKFEAGIAGFKSISSSTYSSPMHDTMKLLDRRSDTFWESNFTPNKIKEYIDIDLGRVFQLNKINLTSTNLIPHGFPETFSIDVSTDKSIWTTLINQKNFNAESSRTYIWEIDTIAAQFIRIEMDKVKIENNRFCIRLSEIEIFAPVNDNRHTHNAGDVIQHASIFQHGIVKLANDGEESPNTVVQGNDSRLRSASTIFKGIVQLAKDGEEKPETAVQASDSRLKKANELNEGIVKLAKDMENNPGVVVQGNDSRLGEATEHSPGIVKLCPDGISSELGVVRGNDARLQKATTLSSGICRLAANGEEKAECVVQSNDKRLRDATTMNKGIAQLAKDGEVKEGLVVQANDRRLKDATVLTKGIVELAEDGEDTAGVVVQGNDKRLKEATTQRGGISKFAQNGESSPLKAVQSNDDRLRDATTLYKGIVQLAKNGEDKEGVAIQGNDLRLKDATEGSKGIVKLAKDGEDTEGVVVQGNDKRLKDATINSTGIVQLAYDGDGREGFAVQGNDKRLKDATTISKGIVELAEDGEDKEGVAVQSNDRRLKIATTKSMGIVQLAEDGEDHAGVVIQGNDKRLKDASNNSKGIMMFADDGGSKPLTAVQASDKRLRNATTLYKGIIELAEDGEDKEGVVVQGNDKRLKIATTKTAGIVKLAENGNNSEGVVVQGNDRRLQNATMDEKGIMRFAYNGEDTPFSAVQGNDKRLREATTEYKGIVRLAMDGEVCEGSTVQSSDKRLKDATTISKGIVELAEDGEDKEGVAVQGNDRRLKKATENRYGIARLAADGENSKGKVVQSNDNRLFDARPPLPHDHDYAPLKHEYIDHTGLIKIIDKRDERLNGIVPPSDGSTIIYAKNESPNPGSIGIAGIANPLIENTHNSYGILGHSSFVGIRGQSSGNTELETKGCGILGVSRFGAGGVFSSEQTFSLVADGYGDISEYDDSVPLSGNGDALFVNGKSEFTGKIYLHNGMKENRMPINIVEMFEIDDEEYVMSGDLLTVSDKGGSILSRARKSYSRSVIGIISGNPVIIMNNSGSEQKVYPVVLAGKAFCRVDARSRSIKPGDLIVTSDTPGCGMAGEIDSFSKIGCVIGKALDSFDDGIGTIPVFVTHS